MKFILFMITLGNLFYFILLLSNTRSTWDAIITSFLGFFLSIVLLSIYLTVEKLEKKVKKLESAYLTTTEK